MDDRRRAPPAVDLGQCKVRLQWSIPASGGPRRRWSAHRTMAEANAAAEALPASAMDLEIVRFDWDEGMPCAMVDRTRRALRSGGAAAPDPADDDGDFAVRAAAADRVETVLRELCMSGLLPRRRMLSVASGLRLEIEAGETSGIQVQPTGPGERTVLVPA